MPNTPLSQLNYRPGHHSEEAELLHHELRVSINSISDVLETKVSKEQFLAIVDSFTQKIETLDADNKVLLNIISQQIQSLSDRITNLE
jgi:hypothetical protein